MSRFRLFYFNIRGLAEPARLCFAAGGVKYEDVRFSVDEWMQKKKEGLSPTGALPMLEVDGKKLNESLAIFRYVARECGLSPSDSFEVAQCDMVVDMTMDLFKKTHKFLLESDEEKKKLYTEEFKTTHLSNFTTFTSNMLKGNNAGKEFLVGSKLSYADIIMLMFYMMENDVDVFKNSLDSHPDLEAHYQRVGAIPGIKNWLETRPKTER